MKKFNGHRCERRNLTDLLLDGRGPDGKKRAQPKAKKRPKNFTQEPAANKRYTGGPASPVNALLGILGRQSMPGASREGNMDVGTQALMEYVNAAQGRMTAPMSPRDRANTNAFLMQQKMDQGLPATAQAMYGMEQSFELGGLTDIFKNIAPGELPGLLAELTGKAGKANLLATAVGSLGSVLENDAPESPLADYTAEEGIGAALRGATNPLALALGPFGMVGGAAISALMGKQANDAARTRYINQLDETKGEQAEIEEGRARNFSRQVLSTYDQQGVTGSFYRKGGPVDYETEGGEYIMGHGGDSPVSVGQGEYIQKSNNLFLAKGPRHKNGGVPTRGATEPYVDQMGQVQDSPYVFSDAKEMKFDATDILSMIS
jgi:hypothetical protein